MTSILANGQRDLLKRFAQRNSLLAFDYDGTLAPIVADPAAAIMRPNTRELLIQLARRHTVAVITGRSRLDVLRLLSGVPVTEVIGNHGFESAGVRPEHHVRRVASWRADLQSRLSGLSGAVLEDKRYSLAIHYRHCDDPMAARSVVWDAAAALEGARLIGGKMVLNIVPDDAPDKGSALMRLQARLNCPRALYVGDDDTDEDVFTLPRSDDLLGVRVGELDDSAADFCITDQAEIDALLEALLLLGRSDLPG